MVAHSEGPSEDIGRRLVFKGVILGQTSEEAESWGYYSSSTSPRPTHSHLASCWNTRTNRSQETFKLANPSPCQSNVSSSQSFYFGFLERAVSFRSATERAQSSLPSLIFSTLWSSFLQKSTSRMPITSHTCILSVPSLRIRCAGTFNLSLTSTTRKMIGKCNKIFLSTHSRSRR
jgi:hypothetical protein